jgi:hypothetical protein
MGLSAYFLFTVIFYSLLHWTCLKLLRSPTNLLGRHGCRRTAGVFRQVSHGKPFLNRTQSSPENGEYLRRSLF